MVYDTIALEVYNGKLPMEERMAIDEWLENSLKADVLLESTTSDVKRLVESIKTKLKNGQDPKDDLEDLKDLCKLAAKSGDIKNAVVIGLYLVSLIGFMVSEVLLMSGGVPGVVAFVISCITLLLAYLLGSSGSGDRVYEALMKEESKAMIELKKAEKDDDKERIKVLNAVIKGCEEAKDVRKETLRKRRQGKAYGESSEELMLEYKGNEIKNYTFVQVLDDMDKLMKMFIANIDDYTKMAESMLKAFKNTKTAKDINELQIKIDKDKEKFTKDDSLFKNNYGPLSWDLLKKYSKKFSTKYSEMGLTTRENFETKLRGYLENLEKERKKYEDIAKDLSKTCDAKEKISYTEAQRLHDKIVGCLNAGYKEIQATIGDILYIISTLNVDKIKTSALYNLLNKNKNDYTVANKAKK